MVLPVSLMCLIMLVFCEKLDISGIALILWILFYTFHVLSFKSSDFIIIGFPFIGIEDISLLLLRPVARAFTLPN